jgi:hypothetical protein
MNKIYRINGESHYMLLGKELLLYGCESLCHCSNSSLITEDYPFVSIFSFNNDLVYDIDFVHDFKIFDIQKVNCYFKNSSDMEKFRVLVTLS